MIVTYVVLQFLVAAMRKHRERVDEGACDDCGAEGRCHCWDVDDPAANPYDIWMYI